MAMTFDKWMGQVNLVLSSRIWGLDSDDLPDLDWFDMYDSGMSQFEAADTAIEEWQYWGDLPRELVGE